MHFVSNRAAVAILAQKNWGARQDWGSGGEGPGKISKTTPFFIIEISPF